MIERGDGRFIHISTIHSQATGESMGSYSVSKGGMNAISRCIAREYAKYGIRSNVICPGFVRTTYVDADFEKAKNDPKLLSRMALEGQIWQPDYGYGRPEAMADTALFLASDLAKGINGALVMSDGGASYEGMLCDWRLPDDYMELVDKFVSTYGEASKLG